MNKKLLRKMWMRSVVGALLSVVLAKPFADWMYLKGYWGYQPTIYVDHPVRLAPLTESRASK